MPDFARLPARIFILIGALALVACATPPRHSSQPIDPHYKIGKPYKINGKWYEPKDDPDYDETGIASWYGRDFHGRMTANGEIFDMNLMSAAHTTLPLPSMVEVTNLRNNKKVVVRVNDRGPFAHNRIIDMSREAARALGFEQNGLSKVRVRYLGRAPLRARAPERGERVRFAQHEPRIVAATPVPTQISPTQGQKRDPSDLVTTIEKAPSLTENAAATIIAQAENPKPGLVEIPAVSLSSDDPGQLALPVEPESSESAIRLVQATPAPDSESAVEALYVVRVASLSQLNNIDGLKAALEPIGPMRMSRAELDDGRVFYRINMGPFSSIETAADKLAAVKDAGYNDASLVTLTP